MEILIDLSILKHPNCGLGQVAMNYGYYYRDCYEPVEGEHITLLVPKAYVGKFGDKVSYKTISPIYKLFPCLMKLRRFDVWHSIHQLVKFKPYAHHYVLTIHDFNFCYERKGSKVQRYIKKRKEFIEKADVVTAISHFAERETQKFAPTTKPIEVIYNGIERIELLEEREPQGVKGPFLFTIGEMKEKKNFHVLLDVMKRLPEYQLYMAGNDNTPYATMIKKRIEREGIGNVHVMGILTGEEKCWMYRHCSAFVFPSLLEGFGLPVVEAMLFRRPVVSSGATSLSEICNGHARFLPEDFEAERSAEVIRKAVQECTDEELDNAFEYAKGLTWRKNAEAYLRIFRSLGNEENKSVIYFIASKVWGGGEEYVYRLATSLKERGYKVAFVLQPRSNAILKERYTKIGDTLQLRVKSKIFKWFPLISAYRVYRFAKRQDIQLMHANARSNYFVAVWAKLFSHDRMKIVATNHLVKRAKPTPAWRWAYRHVDTLINVSECAKREFLSSKKVKDIFKRVIVIRNSVPDIAKTITGDTPFKDSGSPEVKVLYHGRIHHEKGIIDMVSHWHRVHARLYIAGTGLNIPKTENVVNMGFRSDIREILSNFDISLAPSIVKESGGPLSVIEAMAAGKPIVASNNGSQREYVRDGVDGILCDAGDWDGFVEAINRLADDEELRRKMGENGRRHYETELSYDGFVDATEEVYRNTK